MKKFLGEFEETVLTAVCILDQDAYGNNIVVLIKNELNRVVNLSAVHITLYRLEDKGLVISEMRGATAERGGRRKRYFRITRAGTHMLNDLQIQRKKLWRLMPNLNSYTV